MNDTAGSGFGNSSSSEEIFQSFAPHPYQSLNADGEIMIVNDVWLDSLGYEREEVVGRWFGDFLTDESRKKFETRFDEFKSSGGLSNVEFEVTCGDGSTIIVSFDGVIEYDDQGNFVRTHCQFTDITDRKEEAERLAYLESLENQLAEFSRDLIEADSENLDAKITDGLASLGALVDADRSYVFQIDHDTETLSNTHEWTAEGIDPQIETLQDLSLDTFPWWMERLENHEPVTIQDVSTLPPEASVEREILEEQDIHSLIVTPMISEGELVGFIGFDWVQKQDLWSEEFVEPLQISGEIIAGKLQGEKRRRELERREAYLEQSTDIISVVDASGTITYQSTSTERVTGFSPDEVLGQSGLEHLHPEDRKWIEELFPEFVANPGEAVQDELRVQAKDGTWRWIEVRGINKLDDPLIDGLLFSSRDITDRKENEQKLRNFKEAVDEAGHAIYMTDPDGEITYANQAFEDVTGHSPSEAIGRNPRILKSGEMPEGYYGDLWETITSGERWEEEVTNRRKNGEIYYARQTIAPVRTEAGDIEAYVAIQTDITERKEREQDLAYYERLIETFGDIATVIDAEGMITYVSPAVRDVLGYDPDDLVGKDGFDYQPEETTAAVEEAIQYVIEHPDESRTVQTKFRRADGSRAWIESTIQNRLDDDLIEGLLVNSRDISERKEREQEIQQLKERLELAIDGAKLGVWDWDMRTDEVEFNDHWAMMLGDDPEEIDSRLEEWEKRVHPDDMEAVEEALDAHIAGETEYYDSEHRLRTADEDWKWIRAIGKIFERDDEGEPIRAVGIHIDVNQQKQYEQELARARNQLRKIIDLIPDLLFVKDREGEYLLANQTTADVYGLSPEEVEGSKEHEIIPDIEDSEAFREDDLAVIESGEPKEIPEEELTTADGETKILQTIKIPYETSGKNANAVLGYARDVTELKEYERTLERQRDNLEVLNQVVRHDIRNDLQLVLAYTEILEEHVKESGEEYVQQVLEAARDSVDITKTAREVSEVLLQQQTERSSVRLRSVLEHEIEDVRSSHELALVTVEGSIPDVEVLADEMLESVFRNLLKNAIKHNDKEIPEVAVSARTADEAVKIRIADNGPGIPDDQKERVFEEGETGIDSEGTGLGLYLVQTLVNRYEGQVWVEDNNPEGSVFVVELSTTN